MEKYNVYLIRVDTMRGLRLRAENVDYKEVERLESIPQTHFLENFIAGYEVGSPRDLELSKQVKQYVILRSRNINR